MSDRDHLTRVIADQKAKGRGFLYVEFHHPDGNRQSTIEADVLASDLEEGKFWNLVLSPASEALMLAVQKWARADQEATDAE